MLDERAEAPFNNIKNKVRTRSTTHRWLAAVVSVAVVVVAEGRVCGRPQQERPRHRAVRRGGRRWDDHQHLGSRCARGCWKKRSFEMSLGWARAPFRTLAGRVPSRRRKKRVFAKHNSKPSTLYNCAFPSRTRHYAQLGVALTTPAPTHGRSHAASHTGNADAGSVGPAQQRAATKPSLSVLRWQTLGSKLPHEKFCYG